MQTETNAADRFRAAAHKCIQALAAERGLGEWERITSPRDDDTTALDDLLAAVDAIAGAQRSLQLLAQAFGRDVVRDFLL